VNDSTHVLQRMLHDFRHLEGSTLSSHLRRPSTQPGPSLSQLSTLSWPLSPVSVTTNPISPMAWK